ncbi:MAG: hypothetical protein FWG96_01900 [Methanomassiliicoccaceae archaeon]|nr:hypothetical protein [Methanomassiliicoccaceae archaeon]
MQTKIKTRTAAAAGGGRTVTAAALALALFAITVLALFLPATDSAHPETDVPYLDENGETKYHDVTVLTSSSDFSSMSYTLSSGWYLIRGSISLTGGNTVYINGDVHLILEDGSDFTTRSDNSGINVIGTNSLTIYSQSADDATMGKLTARSTQSSPGIGGVGAGIGGGWSGAYNSAGGVGEDCGTVTINGGIITATSGNGAGIGGGYGSSGSSGGDAGNGGIVTINGGIVTATGGNGAGIGGGNGNYTNGGNGGILTVNGGTVNAQSAYSAGIGGGRHGGSLGAGAAGGTVTINNGTVIANSASGVGIGGGGYGGQGGPGGTITINNGTVIATSDDGVGIGGGSYGGTIIVNDGIIRVDSLGTGGGIHGAGGQGGTVTINGGTIEADSIGDGGTSAYSYINGNGGTITINGGTVEANTIGTGGNSSGDRNAGTGGNGGTVIITGGTVEANFIGTGGNGGGTGPGIGGGNGGNGGTVTITGGTVEADSVADGGNGGSGYYYDGGDAGNGGTVTIAGGVVKTRSIIAGGNGGLTTVIPGNGGDAGNGGNIMITGGTVEANSIGRGGTGGSGTVHGIDGIAGDAVVTGGSTNADIQGIPTNDQLPKEPVYLTTVILPTPNTAVTMCAVTILPGNLTYVYGFQDVVTDDDGKIYLWLPESGIGERTKITLTAGGETRSGNLTVRDGAGSPNVLNLDYTLINGVRYILPDGTQGTRDNVMELTGAAYFGTDVSGGYMLEDIGPSGGWFIITDDIDIGAGNALNISGDIYLIVGAGCTLSVAKGVTVGSGSTFCLYTEDPDFSATGTVYGILSVADNIGVAFAGGTFTNTATIISVMRSGVIPTNTAAIINGVTGTIRGDEHGVRLDMGGTITNSGLIEGTNYAGILSVGVAHVTNNPGGTIRGGSKGIELSTGGTVTNAATAVITGAGGVYIGDFDGFDGTSGDVFTNSGLIEGTSGNGVQIADGTDILVTNSGAGTIKGTANGIYLAGGTVDNSGSVYCAAGGEYGVRIDGPAAITNDGDIEGPGGIMVGWLDYGAYEITNTGAVKGNTQNGIDITAGDRPFINNYGVIYGEVNGIVFELYSQYARVDNSNTGSVKGNTGDGVWFKDANGGGVVNNYAAGTSITGADTGIRADSYAEISNNGTIAGAAEYGIICDAAFILNGSAGMITGYIGMVVGWLDATAIISSNPALHCTITNNGTITGTNGTGIYVDDGDGGLIANTGSISSTNGSGILAFGGGIRIFNDGGTITSDNNGIHLGSYGNVDNDNSGNIAGTGDGIYLAAGGEIRNYSGEIKGGAYGIHANSGAVIENWDLITGDVLLSNGVNRAAFAADSVIDGNFTIGSDANSELYFIGSPNLVTMVYATVNGAADIGAAKADIDPAGLPAGLVPGDKIILIDGSAGTMSGTPANPTLAVGGYDLRISVVSDQLIAEVFIPVVTTNYIITATSDSMTTISPQGKTSVQRGNDITFVFSANAGFYINAVIVDGVHLSQTDIRRGSYSFYNVNMNHSIQVTGSTTRVGGDMTLTIGTIEGKGYAEYSVDGGASFARYTSTVVLSENTDLIIRAVAEGGYEFKEWREGNDVYKTSVVTFYNNGASVNAELYFSHDRKTDNTLLIIAAAAALIVFVTLLIAVIVIRTGGHIG